MSVTKEPIFDSNYIQYLLMGLNRQFKNEKGISKTRLRKLPPARYSDISDWERKHAVLMPEDLRLFYLSSNGFSFTWLSKYRHEYENDIVNVKGNLKINSIEALIPIYGYATSSTPGVNFDGENFIIKLSLASKVFKLAPISDSEHVVLVYLDSKYIPTICSFTENGSLNFLANDLATYFRMAIVHLAIPDWQLAYTESGIPLWSENVFRLLAPHLLPLNEKLSKSIQKRRNYDNLDELPINKLDPYIFQFCTMPPTFSSSSSTTEECSDTSDEIDVPSMVLMK